MISPLTRVAVRLSQNQASGDEMSAFRRERRGRHGSSEQAKPMEDASKRSSRTNSHSRQVPLHPPRHQHLHLYPYSRPHSIPSSSFSFLFSLPIQYSIQLQTEFNPCACRCTVRACSRRSI